jgi:sialic acid synthase SpsE
MKYDNTVFIGEREISVNSPCYFIADIASNHDCSLERAKRLIELAKESGADAVKFQHFKAPKIVSNYGFNNLGENIGHQASWGKSVYEVYEQHECPRGWSEELVMLARNVSIDFLTTPYDIEAVELLDDYLSAYKIGSGDITWIDFIEYISRKNKPVILATGAATFDEVIQAAETVLKVNKKLILLQCNTNYTGSYENFKYVNLNVLKNYAIKYPQMLLGLSDHTPGHSAVLGAIAIGAKVIEKHFPDDNSRICPDHAFSMNPNTWREMISRSRELEAALGDGIKRIEQNEDETLIIQRRCLRLRRNMKSGEKIQSCDLEALRPSPASALAPFYLQKVIGKTLTVSKIAGDTLYLSDIEE